MKTYPKIYYNQSKFINNEIYAFDKIDGSNIRFEWNKNKGWFKFGTRTQLIDSTNENFGESINIFMNKYSEDLNKVIFNKYKNIQNIVVFCEYYGENSFAGLHDKNDKMDLILFDVNLYKRGFITPLEFLNNFSHLDIPNLIYNGKYTENFINDVKNNKYGLSEGVICKYSDKKENVFMTKIKTNEWLEKVKMIYGKNKYNEEIV